MIKEVDVTNLSTCTAQEVFDFVVNHLLSQGKPCINNNSCQYRHDSEDLMCAAGCLIPDEIYSIDFEGSDWNSLVENGLVPDNHRNLISELQTIHDDSIMYDNDNNHVIQMWKSQLKTLARDYNLNWHF